MLGKHQSVTSDTRITASLNHSLPGAHPANPLAKQLLQSEQCEIDFLRRKNSQLQERLTRMSARVTQLESHKLSLLALNQKYVKVVNEYYRRAGKENRGGNGSLLLQLEKDHRNLVKHCLNMQEEIKNYVAEMGRFSEWRRQLLEVKHTEPKELIDELRCLTDENKVLKQENNKLEFQLVKSRQECLRLKKNKEQWQDKADEQASELQRYRSLVNTIQQQSTDKSNAYEAKIYELEIKVERLEKELRKEQENAARAGEMRRRLEIQQVEHVHERDRLRLSVREKKGREGRGVLSMSFYK